MKFNGNNLQILDKIEMQRLSFHEAPRLFQASSSLEVDLNFLSSKNVVLSGEFFLLSKKSFKENLEREANVQPEITPETEILLCGQYPDWMLVEEARIYGIKILFVDKAGEMFSRIATKLKNSRPALSYEEPMGV